MKLLPSDNKRRYFKRILGEVTQPTLTSNGIPDEDYMYVTWYTAHGGVQSASATTYTAFYPNNGSLGYTVYKASVGVAVGMYFKNPIKPTKLSFQVSGYGGSKGTILYGSNNLAFDFNNSDQIQTIGDVPIDGAVHEFTIDCSKYYKFLFFYGYTPGGLGGDHLYFSNIKLDGVSEVIIEGTEQDYDFYTDHTSPQVFKLPNAINYYKYDYEDFCLPVYNTGNIEDGVNDISIKPLTVVNDYSNNIAYCINNRYYTTITNSYDSWYEISFKYPAKIQKMALLGWTIANQLPHASIMALQGFDENFEEWVDLWNGAEYYNENIQVNNESFYKRYKVKFCGSETNIYGSMGFYYFNLYGVRQVVKGASKNDYDFYTYTTNRLSAIKSYGKGQYYGN